MEEHSRHGNIEVAGLKAGMGRKTAAKYIREGKLPSDLVQVRTWRTRRDPFEGVWPEIAARLKDAPELEAKIVFEDLQERYPDLFPSGQLRTLQRRMKQWRAQCGPAKTVFFPQQHRPGEAAQTDFTWATELGITIGGEVFPHMLCHFVLPYSNWQWATTCQSESLLALRHGVQEAVFRLGRVPKFHQTDHSTAATHKPSKTEREEAAPADLGFNENYLALMRHLGMKPRTTQVGAKEQNGDVESLNGALKRRLKQHLLLRGDSNFESVDQYEEWLFAILRKANTQRAAKVSEELAVMKALRVDRLREYDEVVVAVTSWSTIRIKRNTYSVPSQLMRERVRVRLFEDRLEVWHGSVRQLVCERLRGVSGSLISYRHIIWSLVRKPGAFPRYRYREALFPSLTFRRSYDALSAALSVRQADVEYLRSLKLAAETMESSVEVALDTLLSHGELPLADRVKALVAPEALEIPELAAPQVDLDEYDELLLVDNGALQELPA